MRRAGGAGNGEMRPTGSGLPSGEKAGLSSRPRFFDGSRLGGFGSGSDFLAGLGFLSLLLEERLLLLRELLPLELLLLLLSDLDFFGLLSRRLESLLLVFLLSGRLDDFESLLVDSSALLRRRRGSRDSFVLLLLPDST